ncbi:hypothetical protein HPB50_002516 [Hyalomma asiaticum]|uniref:Uncharacterized protein n=1 Tax=Hyalomma asiaticum TaxID=266040 RepID=A0ACB7SD60_HYAAI|nr:hypothetical protein HPB50_002516 [Hyalomma asiaticum]
MAACGASSESSVAVFSTPVGDRCTAEDATVERLLEGIRSHPCVYDVKRLDYRDAERKANAWEAIRKQCGLATVDEFLKLWKKLRDRFNRVRKLIEQSKRSGSGYVAKRSWEFLSAMEFYKDCGRMRPTVSNVCTSQEVASQDITVEELVSDMCGTRSV